jgi:hypothetical protein
MELASTGIASIKPLVVGFKKWKQATNNGNKVLLSYSTTIYFIFAHPTLMLACCDPC